MKVVSNQCSEVRKVACSLALSISFFALCVPAHAQRPMRTPQIGFLAATTSRSNLPRLESFRQGLRELGYIEGQNVLIEYRFAEGRLNQVRILQQSWSD